MANLLIIEGTPGSGKTTLVNRLSKELGLPVFPRNRTLDSSVSLHYDYNLVTFNTLDYDCIFDRSIWSDVIFSYIRQRLDVRDKFFEMRSVLRAKHKYMIVFADTAEPLQTHSAYNELDFQTMRNIYYPLLVDEDWMPYNMRYPEDTNLIALRWNKFA